MFPVINVKSFLHVIEVVILRSNMIKQDVAFKAVEIVTSITPKSVAVHLSQNWCKVHVLYDFLITVKAAPHECVIRTGQSQTKVKDENEAWFYSKVTVSSCAIN